MTNFLSKEDIFQVEDISVETMEVPEWGGTIRLKPMTGAEKEGFEAEFQKRQQGENKINTRGFRGWLISRSVVNEDGELLFSKGDIAELSKKSAKVLEDVFEKCLEVNGIGQDAVEEIEKNL